MQNGIRNVVSRMSGIEKPSTPSLKRMVSVSQDMAFHELERGRVPISNRAQATSDSRKVGDRRGKRRPAGVRARRLAIAAQGQDEGRADKRQDEKAGEDAEAEHQCALP